MKKKKEKIEDSLMNILKHKKLKDIKIQEIKKKTRIKSEEFNILYKSKEQIIISFFCFNYVGIKSVFVSFIFFIKFRCNNISI